MRSVHWYLESLFSWRQSGKASGALAGTPISYKGTATNTHLTIGFSHRKHLQITADISQNHPAASAIHRLSPDVNFVTSSRPLSRCSGRSHRSMFWRGDELNHV